MTISSELFFRVEEWSPQGRHERQLKTLAACCNLIVAMAAYDAAVAAYSSSRIMLRDGARVIRDTEVYQGMDLPGHG